MWHGCGCKQLKSPFLSFFCICFSCECAAACFSGYLGQPAWNNVLQSCFHRSVRLFPESYLWRKVSKTLTNIDWSNRPTSCLPCFIILCLYILLNDILHTGCHFKVEFSASSSNKCQQKGVSLDACSSSMHTAHALTNWKVMKGTQVQSHVIIIRQEETAGDIRHVWTGSQQLPDFVIFKLNLHPQTLGLHFTLIYQCKNVQCTIA